MECPSFHTESERSMDTNDFESTSDEEKKDDDDDDEEAENENQYGFTGFRPDSITC